jgi:hypothetical protein
MTTPTEMRLPEVRTVHRQNGRNETNDAAQRICDANDEVIHVFIFRIHNSPRKHTYV